MKRNVKSLLAILMVFVLLSSLVPSFAAEGTEKVSVSSAQAAPGETVSLKVKLESNPGVAAVILDVAYDDTVMTLDSISYGSTYASGGEQPETYASPVRLSWSDTKEVSAEEFATLNFTVNSTASAGASDVTVSYKSGDICDIDEENVDFACIAGSVTVSGLMPHTNRSLIVSGAEAKPGETVSLKVKLENNPGVAAVILDVAYDDTVLTLNSISYGGTYVSGGEQPETLTSPVRLSWSDTKEATAEEFATLNFTVNSAASAGSTNVTVSYKSGDICDIDEENVDFTCVAGVVAIGEAEIFGVKIDSTNFPDDAFRSFVSENFDTSGDGALSYEEIADVEGIWLSDIDITDLTGIQHFTSLTNLSCSGNEMTSVNMSECGTLKTLYFQNCSKLVSLDVSNNTALESLEVFSAPKLSSLNLGDTSPLKELKLYYCPLTELDVTGCSALEALVIEHTQLASLDVSNKSTLDLLICDGNTLTSLDVNGCSALTVLACANNLLTGLNLGGCSALSSLDCENNRLSKLNISDTAMRCTTRGGPREDSYCRIGYQHANGNDVVTTIIVKMTEAQQSSFIENCKQDDDGVEAVTKWSEETHIDIEIDEPPAAVGATITAPEGGWVEGENTFTVACEKACVLLVTDDGGKTYTRLKATAGDGEYSFTANLTEDSQIVCAVKGDLSGDGRIRANEAKAVLKASAGGSVTALQKQIADVNGDGRIRANEAKAILKASAGGSLSW